MLLFVAFSQKEMLQVYYAESLAPVFDYKTTEMFTPDISAENAVRSDNKKEAEVKTTPKADNSLEDYFHFQLADPKGLYLPPLKNAGQETNTNAEKPAPTDNKEKTDLKITPAPQQEKIAPETQKTPPATTTAKTSPEADFDFLDNIDVLEDLPAETTTPEKMPETTEVKVVEEPEKPDLKDTVEVEKELKTTDRVEEKNSEENKGQENLPEELKIEEVKTSDNANFTKEDIKDAQIVPPENETVLEDLEIEMGSDSEKVEETISDGINIEEDPESSDLSTKNDNIDYYLKKYTSTLQGEANKTDYQYSLMEPFKQSLFYDVLRDNKYETIELQTRDVTADFKPEAVVSYNIPLGAEGEYACQLMVLVPSKEGLSKVWVSELIPGEIDSVMIQDVNNDAQNDIVSVSTTGGVSLLKSIRVYSFDKSKNTFNTIFALNSIMEGIVNVAPGKILISETFPGGINRAALYVWNGKRFERLEL